MRSVLMWMLGIVILPCLVSAGWFRQTSGTTFRLCSVHFPADATTGYGVGHNGTILKTTNGGLNWFLQNLVTVNNLYSVHFPVDDLTGYAVGQWGEILKTTNGGAKPSQKRGGSRIGGACLEFAGATLLGLGTGVAVTYLTTNPDETEHDAPDLGPLVYGYCLGMSLGSWLGCSLTGSAVGQKGSYLRALGGSCLGTVVGFGLVFVFINTEIGTTLTIPTLALIAIAPQAGAVIGYNAGSPGCLVRSQPSEISHDCPRIQVSQRLGPRMTLRFVTIGL